GVKAGIFTGLLVVLLVILLTRWASLWIEHWAFAGWYSPTVGIVLTTIVGLMFLVGAASFFLRTKTQNALRTFEDQGWFSLTVYKRSQGLLVRRASIFGVVVIIGCGIFTLIEHKTLDTGSKHWQVNIPFTGMVTLTSEGDLNKPYDGRPVLDSIVPVDQQYERIKDPGDSTLEAGRLVSRRNFLNEEKALKDAGKEPPTGNVAIDRFEMRNVLKVFKNDWVIIEDPGDLIAKYSEGQVTTKKDFEDDKSKIKNVVDEPKA